MIKNRSTLKGYFIKGSIPTETNFADLIDSMLNQDDDNISKQPNDPLRITANGIEENLLNFYRVGEDGNPTWQIKQKPADSSKPGLSISDTTTSRLFIESGTGNVGIGTANPGRKLDVAGTLKISGTHEEKWTVHGWQKRLEIPAAGVIYWQGGGGNKNSYGIGFSSDNMSFLHTTFNDNETESNPIYDITIDVNGNVGMGTTIPINKLDIMGDIAVQNKHAIRGNDAWLRLNQDGVFPSGVHTPGLFAPGSLNVGGVAGWGNPGANNAWIAGTLGVGGPVMQKLEVIPSLLEWNNDNSEVLNYFRGKLAGQEQGTFISAISRRPGDPGFANFLWIGWVGSDGLIKVAHIGQGVNFRNA
jgi:hypothetical protein